MRSSAIAHKLIFPLFVLLFTPGLFRAGISPAQAQNGALWTWGANDNGSLGDGTITARSTPGRVYTRTLLTGTTSSSGGSAQFSAAIRPGGEVVMWGNNSGGNLGVGTKADTNIGFAVRNSGGVGNLTGVVQVATGQFHTLALKSDGTIWAWGDNFAGDLGDSTTTERLFPVQTKGPGGVGFLTDVKAIAAGNGFSLALKSDGTVWAWGSGSNGRLGNNLNANSSTPVQVKGIGNVGFLTGVQGIAAGSNHGLALLNDGSVCGWGQNIRGQLGDNTTTQQNTPVPVHGVNNVGSLSGGASIAAGDVNSAALMTDGTVLAWGENTQSQIGDNTTTQRNTPVQVLGPGAVGMLTGVAEIAVGHFHIVARKTDGSVWAWGYNAFGQLGDNSVTRRATPVQVKDSSGAGFFIGAVSVAAGLDHTVLRDTAGQIWSIGSNNQGELGNGTASGSALLPVKSYRQDALFGDVASAAGGQSHLFALKKDSTIWVWGDNVYGNLGDGTTTDHSTPEQVVGSGGVGTLQDVVAAATGNFHTLVLFADGSVNAWGRNALGALGDGTAVNRSTPVPVKGPGGVGFLTGIVQIACGTQHSLALKANGTVWAWGYNGFGGLGDGTTNARNTPVQVQGPGSVDFLTGVVQIAAGDNFSLALKSDGTVWAWGDGSGGKLGNGTTVASHTPVQVLGAGGVGFLDDVAYIAAGDDSVLALLSDGTVRAWGLNTSGQLGDNTNVSRSTPVQVKGPGGSGVLTDIVSVAGGSLHSLALKSNGTVLAWGSNSGGVLGDGTITQRLTPVQVVGAGGVGTLTDIIAIGKTQRTSNAIQGAGVISGSVSLDSQVCVGTPLRFEFRPVGGGNPIVKIIASGPAGVFSFSDVPQGTYDIAVKGSKWLQRVTQNVNTINGNILNLRVNLVPGDATDDNHINFDDFQVLADAYFTVEGDLLYNDQADFNCDHQVNFDDFLILAQNYFLDGDE